METLRVPLNANLCFVRLHDADGLCGLGEAFYGSSVVETYLHETVAPLLLELPDPSPEKVAEVLRPYVGYQGGGVENRGNGAIDVALWDLLAQRAGLPLVRMLGGPTRTSVPVYNTCAGPEYVSRSSQQALNNWGLPDSEGDHRYEDLNAFLTRPGELARELRDEGIGCMKIWPFDEAAERTHGHTLSSSDLTPALRIVDAIREEVGHDIEIMIELHGLWSRPSATMIADALAEYQPYWIEDPLRSDAVDGLAALHADIDLPIAAGETCVGRRGFLALMQRQAIDVATVDPGWTGGLTEARKVASLADTFATAIAPHDCTGPVSLAVGVHLVCSQPNGMIQETARSFMRTWYPHLVEGLPKITDGAIAPSTAPGHGVSLRSDVTDDARVVTRITARE